MNEKLSQKVAEAINCIAAPFSDDIECNAINRLKESNLLALYAIVKDFLETERLEKARKIIIETSKIFFARKTYEYGRKNCKPFINILFIVKDAEGKCIDSKVIEYTLIMSLPDYDDNIFEYCKEKDLQILDNNAFDHSEDFSALDIFYACRFIRMSFTELQNIDFEFSI